MGQQEAAAAAAAAEELRRMASAELGMDNNAE
jgi:hypothetical protein